MGQHEMLCDMKTDARRRLAGQIVRDEIARMGRTVVWAAMQTHMSTSTLNRMMAGEMKDESFKLRSIEGALLMPDQLLSYIYAGDVEAINAIGATEMREGMRRIIMGGLERIEAEERDDNTKAQ